MTTLAHGDEVTWAIRDAQDGTLLCIGGPYGAHNGGQSTPCCLPDQGGPYTLQCIDAYGDGWNGAVLHVGGVRYCENFTAGNILEVGFTLLDPPSLPAVSMFTNPTFVDVSREVPNMLATERGFDPLEDLWKLGSQDPGAA